jgi:hypothetical protein
MDDIRIINTKTGDVKTVAPHIANNAKLLKSYGYMKQDLGKKEELRDIVIPPPIVDQETPPPFNGGITEESMTEDQAREKYFELFGKKAGNKSLSTILKDIETIQK